MADKNGFLLRIITPDRVFYENQVDMVEFNTTEGEVGILPGHIPMTVIVKPGVLCIGEPEGEKLAALHAGFAEILAEVIEWPGEIDESRAVAAKERAEGRLQDKTPDTDIARAETALQRAIVRIQALK